MNVTIYYSKYKFKRLLIKKDLSETSLMKYTTITSLITTFLISITTVNKLTLFNGAMKV